MKLIIVGAGGLGREIYSWLQHTIADQPTHGVAGFLDDNPNALGDLAYPVPILGPVSTYQPQSDERLVVSIGDPASRQEIVASLTERGARFYTLVHPTAVLGTNVEVGEGSILSPHTILTCDIQVGRFVFINTSSTVGHDSVIGDFTTVNGKVEITGHVQVGRCCFFGVGACVIPGRRIGDGAVVGAGSVVIRHVAEGVSVFGNPAKTIGKAT